MTLQKAQKCVVAEAHRANMTTRKEKKDGSSKDGVFQDAGYLRGPCGLLGAYKHHLGDPLCPETCDLGLETGFNQVTPKK